MYTGLTLRHDDAAPPGLVRRGRGPSPSRLRGRRRSLGRGTRSASSASAVTIDGSRAAAGTIAASSSRRTDERLVEHRCAVRRGARRRRRPGDRSPGRRCASAPKSPIVSWKRRGRAVVEHAERLAVEHEVTAGQARDRCRRCPEPIGDVVEVAGEQAHVAAGRWACTRAPSSFHSTDAAPVAPSAAATSLAGLASIGSTGRLGCKRDRVERLPTLR